MRIPVKSEPLRPLRAAQYLRMSTEHQQYSIVNQSAAIALYAAAHEIVIVRSYIDSGKSGVCIKGRDGLQDLIQTVQAGTADFQCILVYDISRWGRFQDMDEAAHYEYLCKNAGIYIRYCAEQFENDNTMLSGLLKTLKRMMAGEYSRELSVKVFAAQSLLASMGFSQGGPAIYGIQRLLVDSNSNPKQILRAAERKALHSDRVVFIPGPPEETQIVRKIFDLCTIDGRTTREIAFTLNEALVRNHMGKRWIPDDIRRLIMNPKYMGTYVWARKSKKLHAPRTTNNRDQWVVRKDAIGATVSSQQYAEAQSRLALQRQKYTNEQMLKKLRRLWKKEGTLSVRVINEAKQGPGSTMFKTRFGRLANAFAQVGFKPYYDYGAVRELNARMRQIDRSLRETVVEQLKATGVQVAGNLRLGVLTLNGDFGLAIKVVHYKHRSSKWPRLGWPFRINFPERVQILIIACLDRTNQKIQAQYIFPRLSRLQGAYMLNDGAESVFLSACRSDSLQPLLNAVSRCPINTGG